MEIEKLLEKYWEGETSIQEEREIKSFFKENKNLPPELEIYRKQFAFFGELKEEKGLNDDFDKKIEQKLKSKKNVTIKFQPNYWQWAAGIAASIALFITGFYFGSQKTSDSSQISDLKGQMKDLKETIMMAQLKQSSASERIKGVNYVYEMKEKSSEVLDALIETMNTDENPNVRLAAANALFTFKDATKARSALVESIKVQTDPSVKIALINMMIILKEKKAKPAIEEFLQKEPIPNEVKESIRKELKAI